MAAAGGKQARPRRAQLPPSDDDTLYQDLPVQHGQRRADADAVGTRSVLAVEVGEARRMTPRDSVATMRSLDRWRAAVDSSHEAAVAAGSRSG
jgi:hypothetical protein